MAYLFDANLFMQEPFYNTATKVKPSIHIHSDFGLSGYGWSSTGVGMDIGPGALQDHWGLAHEFTHAWQFWWASNSGLSCANPYNCQPVSEGHANYVAHQLPEYASNAHCTEMLANDPHLYLGSNRDMYCNWQYMEYLKDKYCPAAVNQMFTTSGSEPFANIQKSRAWTATQFNDFFGDWAMHNVVWDYKVSGSAFRSTFGNITATDSSERLRRLMPLEALDANWATNRHFASPFYGAPQRLGYNVVRLYPESGATTITVKFRGVNQTGSNADFRWGLVATDSQLSSARYSAMQKGLDGQLTFSVKTGEPLFLVVAATPTVLQTINAEQDYNTIWRYPYMIELANAWPAGFQGGQRDACPTGTVRFSNGGGCAPTTTPSTVYVGPYAKVMPNARVTGTARIEDEAIIVNGTVSGGTVGGLSIVGEINSSGSGNTFKVSGSAKVHTTFYPLGFYESGQSAAGSLNLYGDVEYRGTGLSLTSGNRSGFVDQSSTTGSATDINAGAKSLMVWR